MIMNITEFRFLVRVILSIQGDRNIEFKVYASDDELNMFRGGA